MGFACTLSWWLLVVSRLKSVFQIIISLALPDKSPHLSNHAGDDNDSIDRPPASLVPLPPHLMVDSTKKRLAATRISECGLSKSLASAPLCIVCMDGVDAKEDIQQLSNCRHVFHMECLDRWIEIGHVTCPLCRSKLLPDCEGGRGKANDPWRMERMIYLFGEDYMLGT